METLALREIAEVEGKLLAQLTEVLREVWEFVAAAWPMSSDPACLFFNFSGCSVS
jgi:hypothetical protein